jgi:hypothetical protein
MISRGHNVCGAAIGALITKRSVVEALCLCGIGSIACALAVLRRFPHLRGYLYCCHSRTHASGTESQLSRRQQRSQVRDLEIEEVLSAPRSPWQRAYVERVIGMIRRECLDDMIVFGETSLRRNLRSYFDYYHESSTHLSLSKDAPHPRPVQPAKLGQAIAIPQVFGLHHRYERRAAFMTIGGHHNRITKQIQRIHGFCIRSNTAIVEPYRLPHPLFAERINVPQAPGLDRRGKGEI